MTNEQNAEWRDCVGLDGYEVSNAGQVRRKDTGRVLGQRKNDWGYMRVSVRVDGKSKHRTVHGLVAEAFLGERDGREVNHKNGVKADNNVGNLEWTTRAGNQQHSRDVLGSQCIPIAATNVATGEVAHYASAAEAARLGGFDRGAIARCALGLAKTHRGYLFAYEARNADKELADWRALFIAYMTGKPIWPNNWHQDVAAFAFAIHRLSPVVMPSDTADAVAWIDPKHLAALKRQTAATSALHHIRVSLKPTDARTAPLYSVPPATGATA